MINSSTNENLYSLYLDYSFADSTLLEEYNVSSPEEAFVKYAKDNLENESILTDPFKLAEFEARVVKFLEKIENELDEGEKKAKREDEQYNDKLGAAYVDSQRLKFILNTTKYLVGLENRFVPLEGTIR